MKAAVAAGHELPVFVAADILENYGNAFDAALAAMLVSCVCEPVLASPGGGGYLMARKAKTGEVAFHDFFVHAPHKKRDSSETEFYATRADFGGVTQEFHIGAGASAVPGILPGFFAIHSALSRYDISALVEPAFRAAAEGVEINSFQAWLFPVIEPILTASPEAKNLFMQSGGLPCEGEIFRNPGLARLFQDMYSQGQDICQKGDYVDAIIHQSSAHGGHLAVQDFRDYRVKKRKPLEIMFRGYKVYLPPPPAAGGTLVAFGLLLLEKMLEERRIRVPDLVDLVRVMEQSNLARENGGSGGDLLSGSAVARGLDQVRKQDVASKGTTHISVIDAEQNIAALTLTNGEGNGRLVGDYGFMLNNMLGEEDLHPDGFHSWQPGQRLSSMMTPTLIQSPDGQWIALGSGGSNRIRTAILQVIVNLVSREMSLQQAIDTARIHAEKCGTLSFEQSVALETYTKQELAELAVQYPGIRNWAGRNMFFGGVHAVSGGDGHGYRAAADCRRSGFAMTL